MAIFVKTPSLSPVKSRLWPAIGRRRAEALHLLAAEAVASVAQQAGEGAGISPYWAVAEEAALHTDAWVDLPHLAQGRGGLGERMAQVYRQLLQKHRAAMLVGADAPQLACDALHRGADWLGSMEPRLVMGRAHDGGFWLFGGNVPLDDRGWAEVRYSTGDTANQFVHAMGRAGRWLELAPLRDIDTAEDISPVRAALHALRVPTPAQVRLRDWLGELTMAEACP